MLTIVVGKTSKVSAADQTAKSKNTVFTKLPPPPGFIPPTLPPRTSHVEPNKLLPPPVTPTKQPPIISVLNPQPAITRPPANYKLTPSPTRSILRQNSKKSNNRVSFDLELTNQRLAPKMANPSMPDLSKLMREAEEQEDEEQSCKNPFLDPAFKMPNETVKLGETFFSNLFLNTNPITNTFTDPWSAIKKVSSTPKIPSNSVLTPVNKLAGPPTEATLQGPAAVKAEDKYSALKELDEIFKTTCVMDDGKSTGTSIFGSSPMTANSSGQLARPQTPPQAAGVSTSVFGPSPNQQNGSGMDNFPTTWGDSKPNENRGFSPNWAAAGNWGSPAQPAAAAPPVQQTKAPINPFTGASNLTQLNTSPWPTTGTSPVQNAPTASSAWPPASNSNNTTASAGFFGMNQNQTTDPFGAAPATNLQKTGNCPLFSCLACVLRTADS